MKFRGGASCHAERLTELEEGTFPLTIGGIFRTLDYVASWLNRLSFTGSTLIRTRTEHSTATDPRAASTIHTIIWQVSGYLSFSIADRFLSVNYRNHQSYDFGTFRYVPLSILGSYKSVTFKKKKKKTFLWSFTLLIFVYLCGYPLIGNEISHLTSSM